MKLVKRKETQMDSESSEAYKALRTNLLFCGNDKKAIVFTSCTPDEGKSTVVRNLAESLAEAEKKVLLVDADLRKSVMVGRFQIEGESVGLSHYLSGLCELEEAVNHTDLENLDVIFAGPDEVITFSHRAYSKAVFGKGAVEAAKYLAGKPAGLYDMQDVIG